MLSFIINDVNGMFNLFEYQQGIIQGQTYGVVSKKSDSLSAVAFFRFFLILYFYSTVTLFARFLGLSTSKPLAMLT